MYIIKNDSADGFIRPCHRSGVLKRLYVLERLGPLSQEEKELIDQLIDTFVRLCKNKIDIKIFQRRCWSFCPTSSSRSKAHLQ